MCLIDVQEQEFDEFKLIGILQETFENTLHFER